HDPNHPCSDMRRRLSVCQERSVVPRRGIAATCVALRSCNGGSAEGTASTRPGRGCPGHTGGGAASPLHGRPASGPATGFPADERVGWEDRSGTPRPKSVRGGGGLVGCGGQPHLDTVTPRLSRVKAGKTGK